MYIPDYIVNYILYLSNIKCHGCLIKCSHIPYKKQGKFYYCCEECYLFI